MQNFNGSKPQVKVKASAIRIDSFQFYSHSDEIYRTHYNIHVPVVYSSSLLIL